MERATGGGDTGHHFHRGSARMFRSDFFERFSRVHPATPAVLFLPVAALAAFVSLFHDRFPIGAFAARVVAGYVLWTLIEYWLHRLFFHLRVVGPRTARLYFLVHGVHHDYPWDTSRLVMPPAVSITIAVSTFVLLRALLGPVGDLPVFVGMALGYVAYDTIHWYVHARAPRGRFGRWLRREHLTHHFKDSSGRFGVSCPWLDHLFGTTGARSSGA